MDTISKYWLRSRTIWAAIIVEALAAAADNWSQLQGYVPEHFYKAVAFGLPVAMVILRRLTTQAVHFIPPDKG